MEIFFGHLRDSNAETQRARRSTLASGRSEGTQAAREGRRRPRDWSFSKADTSYLTHGLHEYPARMIPQIAERLIATYSQEGDRILDPFCGSGTTLVEARLARRNAVGNDVNPLAVLLAKVKSTPIDLEATGFQPREFLSRIEESYAEAARRRALPEAPLEIHPRLLHWFKEPAARDLQFLYERILEVGDPDVQDLLRVVFSDTVLRASNIDHHSSRFIRVLHEPALSRFSPDPLGYFRRRLLEASARISLFTRRLRKRGGSSRTEIDVRRGDARRLPFDGSVFDCAITSPPYGEEENTVGYTRWSRLSVAWLRLNGNAAKETEPAALGASSPRAAVERLEELPSRTAVRLLRETMQVDPARMRQALPFFLDYLDSLKEAARVLRPGAPYCIVIGDRSIRRRPLDMEKVTVELGEAAGFTHRESFFRRIPVKLIPWTTPTGRTISRESIIILERT